MQLSEMIRLVGIYIDDVADSSDILLLLNAAKNAMATEVRCTFPDLVASTDMSDTFVFDAEYHEIPVLYAAAMLKSQDSAVREKESYLSQYMAGISNFAENYDPPVQYLNLPNVQHFIATVAQTDYIVTKGGFHPRYGNLKLYRNSLPIVEDFVIGSNIFKLSPLTSVVAGDIITAVWEMNSDYGYAPGFFPSWG